jgi:uncharacterized protein (TIGR03000 family)
MNKLPLKLPVFLGAALWLALPVNQVLAQKGGRGGGGGVHVSGARVGGAVHVGGVSGVRPVGGSIGHGVYPSHPIHNGNNGFRGNGNGGGVFVGGFGGGWWPGPYYYDGYYGGTAVGPYSDGGYSAYPPGDVFGSPMPGTVIPGAAIPGGGLPGGAMPGAEVAPPPRSATALVVVMVPADSAELWFNGAKTQTKGQRREFVTPELPPGQVFNYEVRVKWTVDGKEFDRTRTVRVQAGSQSIVNFMVEDREQLPAPAQLVPPVIKM